MTREFFCSICSEVVDECDVNLGAFSMDGRESTCPGCGAKGRIVVDVDDEQSIVAEWVAYRGEAERVLNETMEPYEKLEEPNGL